MTINCCKVKPSRIDQGDATDGQTLVWDEAAGEWAPATPTSTPAPTGAILPYAGSAAPSGWLLCNGAAVSRTTYASLFAVCGTSFGVGDGSTTFNIPDLRGRFPFGADATRSPGAVGGEEEHTLTEAEMPAHTHAVYYRALGHIISGTPYSQMGFSTDNSGNWDNVMLSSGGDQPHNNLPPFLSMNFIIKE